jgi:hypothetical protein
MKEGDEIVSMKYALFDDICLTNLVVKEEDEITPTHRHLVCFVCSLPNFNKLSPNLDLFAQCVLSFPLLLNQSVPTTSAL